MRTRYALTLVLSALAVPAPEARAAPRVEPEVYERLAELRDAGLYVIVVLSEGSLSSSPLSRTERIRLAEEEVLSSLGADFETVYRFGNFPALTGRVREDGLAKLAAHPSVRHVGIDRRGERLLERSRRYVRSDVVESVHGFTGEGVTVAVIDDGVEADHPDLEGDIARGGFRFAGQGATVGPGGGGSPGGGAGHGTAVAGIITSSGALAGRGIAPDADILSVNVSENGVTFVSDWAAAVDYVVSVRDDYKKLAALNMSLWWPGVEPGCPCDDQDATTALLEAALRSAREAGIVPVVSAGNTGSCSMLMLPGCTTAAVAVGSVYHAHLGRFPPEGTGGEEECFDAEAVPDGMACFTSRSDCLDLLAPGAGLNTPWADGTTTADHPQMLPLGFTGTSAPREGFTAPPPRPVAGTAAG